VTNTIGFNADEQRFEIHVDGVLAGYSQVRETDEAVTFIHTEIFDQFEGQGLASVLVTWALDDVRARGKKVVAHCPYVRRFIHKHPDYQDLLV